MEVQTRQVASIGAVLHSAWGVTRSNLIPIIVLTLAVSILINAILNLAPIFEDGGLEDWSRYFKLQRFLQFWIGTIGILGVVHLTVASHRGIRLSIGETFSLAFRNYGSALWAQFLYNVALVLGLILLVIPGLSIGVYWFFSLQAIVVNEKSGWQALKHSFQIVDEHWWSFFGRLVILYALMIFGITVLSVPSFFLPQSLILEIISMIPIDLLAAFFTICFTKLYLMSGHRFEEPQTNVVVAPA